VVEIKFFNNPEYNEVVTVRPDGRISLQQIGDLEVVGVSPSELQSLVHQVYGEILKQPM
jgi:protein involved in polysaccharide export with SLBB domain